VRVLEVELGVEVLSLLLELGELVVATVEGVAVEDDWGVEVACEGLLEGVAEVLVGVSEVLEGVADVLGGVGVLTGELLGDRD
jgi:hypothetical protein